MILFFVGIFAALTLSYTYLEVQNDLWMSQTQGEERRMQRLHTSLVLVSTTTQNSGNDVKIVLRNDGEERLYDFDQWDLILQFYSDGVPPNDPALYNYHVKYMKYVASNPQNLQWTVSGIYLSAAAATAEAFEPGILNPGEEIAILAKIYPFAAKNTSNQFVVSTPNGVVVSGFFAR